ncbi:AMP-binding protein [Amycolatopsis speibonae]|uniref:AMP-binding protein n=1 Tax=Amycolatopsis speibonae TaxID=1450224 RepID=A0ABV7P8J2_9PSEU
MTIADLLLARAGDSRPGLRTRDREWTWDEVVRASAARAALARRLRRDGSFHIAVLLENVPEFVFWLGAAALAGATVIGVNPTRQGGYLEQEVRHTEPQFVITDETGLSHLEGLDLGVPRDRYLLVDEVDYVETVARYAVEPARDPEIDSGTPLLLLFTSGTTGVSKAARCSQGRLAGLGHQNAAKYRVGRDDVCYCCMPLFHGNAVMGLWAPALVAGACVALTPKFSASGFLPDVRALGATYFTYVGKAVSYVLATAERPDDRANPLTHGFGTEASPEDRELFEARFGAELLEAYGSSEGAGMVTLTPSGPPSALGRPAHDGVQVVDPETRKTCPRAELDEHGRVRNAEEAIGELVDTRGAAKFEGYWNNPAADAERVRHGWYWTGDLGYVDQDGYLYFAGRSGDWIRVDGENTSAIHVERVLRRHRSILAAAVFGVPDPRSGDQVMAAIEVPEGVTFAELELPVFLAAQTDLGTKGAPRFVRISHGLPSTGSGKLQRKALRLAGWRCAEPVYRRLGRDDGYTLLDPAGREALRREFESAGRLRFLGHQTERM